MSFVTKTNLLIVQMCVTWILFVGSQVFHPDELNAGRLEPGLYLSEDEESGIFSQIFLHADESILIAYQACSTGHCKLASFHLSRQGRFLKGQKELPWGQIELYVREENSCQIVLHGRITYEDQLSQVFLQRFIRP